MANTRGPLNSGEATTAVLVGGVYNESAPAPADQQAMALQVDDQGNLLVNVAVGGGSATQNVNVTEVAGSSVSTAATGVQKVGVVGNAGAAFDAPATGTAPANVLYQGDRAATTYPTAATDGQIVAQMADKAGRLVAVANAPRDLIGTAVVSDNSTASGVSFIGAGASGVYNDIITFIATNRSSTATVVTLTDGTASYTFALAANGGIVVNFPTPLPATSTATAWTIGNSATVACDYIAVYAKNK